MISDFFRHELTYAIATDKEYEYFLIARKDHKEFMKTFYDIGKCYKGNTIGEFLVFDFDELRIVYEKVVEEGITIEESLKRVEDYITMHSNPGYDAVFYQSKPHVNLLLADFHVRLLNLIVINRDNDRITEINFNIDEIIDQYKAIQEACKKVSEEILYLPKETDLFNAYLKDVFTNKLPVIDYTGSFVMLYEYDRLGFISLRTKAEEATDAITKWFIPNSLQDATNYLLASYIENNIHFKTCLFCNRPFALVKKYNSDFCTRPYRNRGDYVGDYEEFDEKLDTAEEITEKITKTCKNYGRLIYYNNQHSNTLFKQDPARSVKQFRSDATGWIKRINKEFLKSYKAHYARMQKGNMTSTEFTEWHREAADMKAACKTGQITLYEFIDWLNKDRLRKPRKTKEKD